MSLPAVSPGPTEEELRDALAEAAAWVSAYLSRVGDLPVLAQVEPGEIAERLPAHAPVAGEPLDAILADVDRLIIPGRVMRISWLAQRLVPGLLLRFMRRQVAAAYQGPKIAAA